MNALCPECLIELNSEGICPNCGLYVKATQEYMADLPNPDQPISHTFLPQRYERIRNEQMKIKGIDKVIQKVLKELKLQININDVIGFMRGLESYKLLHGGRKGELLAGASIYLLGKMYAKDNLETKQATFMDISKSLGTPPRELLRIVSEIKEKDERLKNVDISLDTATAIENLINEMTPHETSEEIKSEMFTIILKGIEFIQLNESQAGRKILSIVGALFLMECSCHSIEIDKQKLARRCFVVPETIDIRMREISLQFHSIAKRMCGNECITPENIKYYISYVIETCIPFVQSLNFGSIMEHPKLIKNTQIQKKRRKQINKIKEKMKENLVDITSHLTREEQLIYVMLKHGMDEEIIESCSTMRELKLRMEKFKRSIIQKDLIRMELEQLNNDIMTDVDYSGDPSINGSVYSGE